MEKIPRDGEVNGGWYFREGRRVRSDMEGEADIRSQTQDKGNMCSYAGWCSPQNRRRYQHVRSRPAKKEQTRGNALEHMHMHMHMHTQLLRLCRQENVMSKAWEQRGRAHAEGPCTATRLGSSCQACAHARSSRVPGKDRSCLSGAGMAWHGMA